MQYHKYVASAFVNLLNPSNYAIGSLGLYFSATAIQAPPNIGFMNIPSPQVKGKLPLTDTLNWMIVQDTFVAQGGELYLTIGNFSYDSLSDTLFLGWRGSNQSYYYIDSVTVFDTGLTGLPENEKESLEVKIFPNPSNGNFDIEYFFKEEAEIVITDMQGRVIERKHLTGMSKRKKANCENLENGVYLYRIISKSYESPSKKLVIVK